MNKGKIIDIQKKYLVVLNDQMVYTKIKKKDGLSVGKEIYYFEEDLYKESKQPVKKYFLVAAVLFMMLFIQPLLVAEEVYGYISVDINPSIELEVNRTLEVLSVEAMNDDAKSIIRDEWIGKPAKEVIDLIIEETQNKGILNKERDFVLVSYYFNDEDPASGEVFVQSLDELFNEKSHDYEVAVIKSDAETHSEAKEAKESLGKQVVNKKMNTKVKDLLAAKKSIEKDEDFKIYKNNSDDSDDDKDHEYSNEKALEENPGQKNEKNPIFGERDDVPGINKQNNNDEAEENNEKEENDDKRNSNDDREDYNRTEKMITPPEAKAIAFALVNGRIIEVDLDRDNSEAEYEIKIILDEATHEIIIDGFTGEIISHENDESDDDRKVNNGNNGKNNNELKDDKEDEEDKEDNEDEDDEKDIKEEDQDNSDGNNEKVVITKDAVEAIAFNVLNGKGEILTFDFDHGDDEAEYTLEIQFNGEIHRMKINGFTGQLVEHEIEIMEEDNSDADEISEENDSQSSQGVINKNDAEKIAFQKIGGQGQIINYNFDEDESRYFFEIRFENEIYLIEIDALTGEVIELALEQMNTDNDNEYDDEENEQQRKYNKDQAVLFREEIEAIALSFVDGEIIELSFEEDDEILEYFVLIKNEEYSHELLINGITGELIEHKTELIKEIDDDEDSTNDEKEED